MVQAFAQTLDPSVSIELSTQYHLVLRATLLIKIQKQHLVEEPYSQSTKVEWLLAVLLPVLHQLSILHQEIYLFTSELMTQTSTYLQVVKIPLDKTLPSVLVP